MHRDTKGYQVGADPAGGPDHTVTLEVGPDGARVARDVVTVPPREAASQIVEVLRANAHDAKARPYVKRLGPRTRGEVLKARPRQSSKLARRIARGQR